MSDAQTLIRLNRQAQANLAKREAVLKERIARLKTDTDNTSSPLG